MRVFGKKNRGFTLVEILLASTIVVIIGVSIIYTVIHTLRFQRFEQERVVALNRASRQVEQVKNTLFPNIRPSTQTVYLDFLNTPSNPSDDTQAQMKTVLRNLDEQEIGQPLEDRAVIVEVLITWKSFKKNHHETITTIIAP